MTFGQFFADNLLMFLLFFACVAGIIFFEMRDRSAAGEKVGNSRAAILANDNGTFIDIRPTPDFHQAHIAGAKNFPLADLAAQLDKIRGAKNRPLIIYDTDGFSVNAAAKILRAGGFEAIFVLDGGINGWLAENLPVVSK
ncbi:rhodanese-like domain-containing protein [Cardiobacterium valvarum]|uniref:Molybdopterin biosynthesis protein MoeB n=1 Tax=Cardiobacterium valvarum TaxID=194702 RepID=A0A381DWP1_9GAMM|nr:rhodanese-like domain-containing protein [Cardiobacterium valvarum]SUX17449.1 molybdopterin biosynthesis protein MoeB [Cardiobacterium valvarum]